MIDALALCALLTAPIATCPQAAPGVREHAVSGMAAKSHNSERPPAIPARVTASTSHSRLSLRHERPMPAVTSACRLDVTLVQVDLYRAPLLAPRSPRSTPSSQRDPPLSTR